MASLLESPCHFPCLTAGIPGHTGFAIVMPALSSHTWLVFEASLGFSLFAEGRWVKVRVQRADASWGDVGRVVEQQALLHLTTMNDLQGYTGKQASLRHASVNS